MTMRGGDLIAYFSGGWLESFDGDGSEPSLPTPPVKSSRTTELDDELLEDVFELVDEVGKTVEFYLYPDAEFDPIESELNTGSVATVTKKVIPPFNVDARQVKGDLVRIDDMFTGVPGKDLEFIIECGIQVGFDSMMWKVQRFMPIYSGEQVCLYILQLRK